MSFPSMLDTVSERAQQALERKRDCDTRCCTRVRSHAKKNSILLSTIFFFCHARKIETFKECVKVNKSWKKENLILFLTQSLFKYSYPIDLLTCCEPDQKGYTLFNHCDFPACVIVFRSYETIWFHQSENTNLSPLVRSVDIPILCTNLYSAYVC